MNIPWSPSNYWNVYMDELGLSDLDGDVNLMVSTLLFQKMRMVEENNLPVERADVVWCFSHYLT